MLKRFRKLFSRRKYLLQLTATYVLMLLIPCFIALLLLFNSSYNQMLGANAESGSDALTRFSAQFQAEMAQYGEFHFMPLPQLDDSLHFYDANHLNQDGVDIFCRAFRDKVIIPKLNSL